MKRRAAHLIHRAGVAGVALVFGAPLVLLAMGSLRTPGLPPPDGFDLVPDALRWSNYSLIEAFVPLTLQARNSLIVATVATVVTVVVASWAGFAIATGSARERRFLIVSSLVALMIPASALWVPRFVMFRWLNVTDTWVPLVLPGLMATTPFYVLLFALAYHRLPRGLFEAARLEGLTPFQTWRWVAWPLGRATAFAVGVLAFAWHWSNFVDALLYLSSDRLFTLPLGLRALQTLEPTNHPILLAAAVLASIPPVVVFLSGHRALFERTVDA